MATPGSADVLLLAGQLLADQGWTPVKLTDNPKATTGALTIIQAIHVAADLLLGRTALAALCSYEATAAVKKNCGYGPSIHDWERNPLRSQEEVLAHIERARVIQAWHDRNELASTIKHLTGSEEWTTVNQ